MQSYLCNYYLVQGCKLYPKVVDNIGLVLELAEIDMVLFTLDLTTEKFVLTITVGFHFKLGIYWGYSLSLGCLPND